MMKKDNSPRVPQREKIKDIFDIRPFDWTEKQKRFIEISLSKDTNIIICKSPPGTGKTLLSIFCCLTLLNNKRIGEIQFLRNPIESSKSLGYLKGEKNEKIDVYATPLYDHLKELISKPSQDWLLKENRIKIDSVGFIKGCTFHNMGIICDEAEDIDKKSFRLLMSRMGKFSKLFIIGDEKQADIKNSAFSDVFNLFNNKESKEKGIHTFEFLAEDCMRNSFMKFILEKFDTLD